MPLPLLSLSSLASRVVLAQDLDTRELPLHLHRQVGDYKRLEGAFTLREVVFEVQRMDGGEVSKEEREEAWQFYLRNKMIATEPETEKTMGTKNKWSVAWRSGQIGTTLSLENPVDIVHDNQVVTCLTKDQHNVKVHRRTYLDKGKVVTESKVAKYLPELGMTEVSFDTSIFEIIKSDFPTPVHFQQFQKECKPKNEKYHSNHAEYQPQDVENQPECEDYQPENEECKQEDENEESENEEYQPENKEFQSKGGIAEVSEDMSSLESTKSDRLTLVRRFEKPLIGLVFTFTSRATRAQTRVKREGFFCVNMHMKEPYPVRPMTPMEQNLIKRLLHYQERFSHPSEAQQQEIDLTISQELNEEDRMLAQITQHTFANVKLIFDFVRRLPGFDSFHNMEQVALLKAGIPKILLLRAARCFNPLSDSVVFSSEVEYDLAAYKTVGLDNRALFHFCHKVHRLGVNPTEFALLTACVMFTDSPVIVARDRVEHVRSVYMIALVSHVYSTRCDPGVELASLLGLLQDLTTLVEGGKEHWVSDKMKAKELPPLLAELWDIPT